MCGCEGLAGGGGKDACDGLGSGRGLKEWGDGSGRGAPHTHVYT